MNKQFSIGSWKNINYTILRASWKLVPSPARPDSETLTPSGIIFQSPTSHLSPPTPNTASNFQLFWIKRNRYSRARETQEQTTTGGGFININSVFFSLPFLRLLNKPIQQLRLFGGCRRPTFDSALFLPPLPPHTSHFHKFLMQSDAINKAKFVMVKLVFV